MHSSIRSIATFAIHTLMGSTLGEGMEWTELTLQLLPDFIVGGAGSKAGVGDDFADGHFRVFDLQTRGVGEAAVIDIGEETAQA